MCTIKYAHVVGLQTVVEVTTLDAPPPVFLAVVVIGRETDRWVVPTANVEGAIPGCLPARPAVLANGQVCEMCTLDPEAPVLGTIVVVRDHARDNIVVRAGVGEVLVPVVEPTRPVTSDNLRTIPCEQRGVETVLAAIVVDRAQATPENMVRSLPVHVTVPAVDPTMPPMLLDTNTVVLHVLLVGALLGAALLSAALLNAALVPVVGVAVALAGPPGE